MLCYSPFNISREFSFFYLLSPDWPLVYLIYSSLFRLIRIEVRKEGLWLFSQVAQGELIVALVI